MPMNKKENTKKSLRKIQVREVSRTLASQKRMCEAGHVIVFDANGSFIFDQMMDEIIGIEHNMRKEEMEGPLNIDTKQGWRFAVDVHPHIAPQAKKAH